MTHSDMLSRLSMLQKAADDAHQRVSTVMAHLYLLHDKASEIHNDLTAIEREASSLCRDFLLGDKDSESKP